MALNVKGRRTLPNHLDLEIHSASRTANIRAVLKFLYKDKHVEPVLNSCNVLTNNTSLQDIDGKLYLCATEDVLKTMVETVPGVSQKHRTTAKEAITWLFKQACEQEECQMTPSEMKKILFGFQEQLLGKLKLEKKAELRNKQLFVEEEELKARVHLLQQDEKSLQNEKQELQVDIQQLEREVCVCPFLLICC